MAIQTFQTLSASRTKSQASPIYIFDLDGTLADITHRMHYIQGPSKDWEGFLSKCGEDAPIQATLHLFKLLVETGASVIILTGRSQATEAVTSQWLATHTGLTVDQYSLVMRPADSRISDHTLKENWLSSLPHRARERISAVFEDRRRVVEMWRRNGIHCYQVADGEF